MIQPYLKMKTPERGEFKSIGFNCAISDDAIIFGANRIDIGDNVRIDAGVKILCNSGYLKIGSHVHIAANVTLLCGGGIEIGDFCSISFSSSLISASDDFSGNYLVGPVFTSEFTNVKRKPIILKDMSAVGAHSLMLPGTVLEKGAVLGAMSGLFSGKIEEYEIHGGSPARFLKKRNTEMILKADEFQKQFDKDFYDI